MKKLILSFFATLLTVAVMAQNIVTGKVTYAGDNSPIVGAVVQVKDTKTKTVSNADGNFSIQATPGQTLVVSSLGLKAVEKRILPGAQAMNFVLDDEAQQLEDLVVVGYGVTKKRDLAGAISQIKGDDVKAGVITNTAQMIKGRAAGVQVRQGSLEPGGNIAVRVRGASSISSNNDPLYVIDGIQMPAGNQVAPEDIASMEILKDAAATAIYGARGANGVVIITTKKGNENKFSIDYSYDISTKKLVNPWKLMNAQDEIQYKMNVWRQNGASGAAPYTNDELEYKGAGTDWVKEMTRNASTQAHAVAITGGSKRLKAATTLVYVDDNGILPNTSFNRLSGRLNIDYAVNDWLRAGVNGYMARTKKTYLNMGTSASTDNVLYWMFMADPTRTMSDEGLNVFGKPDRKETVYFEIKNKDFRTDVNNAYLTFFAEADLLPCLTARAQYSYSYETDKYSKYYNRETLLGAGYKGKAEIEDEHVNYQQLEGLLTFHKNFANRHDLKIIAGTSYQKNDYEYMGMWAHGFTTDAFKYYNMGAASTIDAIATARSVKKNLSFFTRAEYVLLDKYIINASLRADGASNFGADNKWGYFPSVSLAWQLGDEKFMNFIKPAFSRLKLRASYGTSGNDGIGNYKSLRMYSFENVFLGGTDVVKGMYPSNAGNPLLRWETTSQIDLGFDASILNNKLEITFDWYNKKTTDLLNEINISSSTGGLTTTTGNSGSLQNRGWELYIKYNAITKKDFRWQTTLNVSQNKNKVLSVESPTYYTVRPHGTYNYEEYMQIKKGLPLSSIYGYVWDGIIQQGETYTPQPKAQPGDPKFKDLDGDGLITSKDRKQIGKGTPDVTIGWGNNFRYKDFDLSFFFDASLGYDLLNLTRVLLEDNDRLAVCKNRWTKTNPSTDVIRGTWMKNGGLQYGSFVNSHYVENASYLRLSNIEIGYSLPLKKMGVSFMQSCRVFVGAQRLFTITGYSGFDPEASVNGAKAYQQGLDFNSYPSYRAFSAGVKVTF